MSEDDDGGKPQAGVDGTGHDSEVGPTDGRKLDSAREEGEERLDGSGVAGGDVGAGFRDADRGAAADLPPLAG